MKFWELEWGLRTRERWQRGKSTCINVSRIVVDMRISTLYLHISYNLFLTCLYITIPINGIMADYNWFDRRKFPVFTACIAPMRLLWSDVSACTYPKEWWDPAHDISSSVQVEVELCERHLTELTTCNIHQIWYLSLTPSCPSIKEYLDRGSHFTWQSIANDRQP